MNSKIIDIWQLQGRQKRFASLDEEGRVSVWLLAEAKGESVYESRLGVGARVSLVRVSMRRVDLLSRIEKSVRMDDGVYILCEDGRVVYVTDTDRKRWICDFAVDLARIKSGVVVVSQDGFSVFENGVEVDKRQFEAIEGRVVVFEHGVMGLAGQDIRVETLNGESGKGRVAMQIKDSKGVGDKVVVIGEDKGRLEAFVYSIN